MTVVRMHCINKKNIAWFTRHLWSCKGCCSHYTSLYHLVGYVRFAHDDLNSSCGVNECEYYVKKSYYTWYNHVRKQHTVEYYNTDREEKLESEMSDDDGVPVHSINDDVAESSNSDEDSVDLSIMKLTITRWTRWH